MGHIYKVDDALVSSQFLVINKTHALDVKPGDVVLSNQSHGFIEKVVRVNQTSGMVFLETEARTVYTEYHLDQKVYEVAVVQVLNCPKDCNDDTFTIGN